MHSLSILNFLQLCVDKNHYDNDRLFSIERKEFSLLNRINVIGIIRLAQLSRLRLPMNIPNVSLVRFILIGVFPIYISWRDRLTIKYGHLRFSCWQE